MMQLMEECTPTTVGNPLEVMGFKLTDVWDDGNPNPDGKLFEVRKTWKHMSGDVKYWCNLQYERELNGYADQWSIQYYRRKIDRSLPKLRTQLLELATEMGYVYDK